jgi:hypothetical protein
MQGKCTNFIWGYTGGLNSDLGYTGGFESDLGVRKYQKVENPCYKTLYMIENNLIT